MNSQQRRKQRRLEASQAVELNAAACHDSELKWLEASAEGEQKPLKTFSGIAYSGDAMDVGWGPPVVVDLSGMDTSKNVVALMDHDSSQRVGHITAIDVGANRKLKISGKISAAGDAAKTVVADASSGFPWQFSIGATVKRQEFVEAGQKVNVNGRALTGPLIVARQSTLREVSFVAVGADASTSASLAASASKGVREMEFSQWLAAKGIDESTLPEAASTALKASYESDKGARAKPDSVEVKASGEVVATEFKSMKESLTQLQAAIAEQSRIASINSLNIPADLKAKAIKDGLNADAAELQHLRASRPAGPAIHVADHAVNGKVLEAALCQTLHTKDHEKSFDDKTLQAAHSAFGGSVSLSQLVLIAAANNGMPLSPGQKLTAGNLKECLKWAAKSELQASGSTVSLPGILGNVANKEILAGYMEEDQSWREVSQIKSVSNFQQVTSYRMLDSMKYEQLAPNGKIANGTVGQESFTRQAKTYAKMFSLDRYQLINDDLGAFDDLRSRLGSGAARAFVDVFWTEFLRDHATFYTTARTNYITGSTTNLLTDGVGLGLGVKAFRQMRTPTGDGSKRVGGSPVILLVPPELEAAAEILYQNSNINMVAGSSANIYANKYRPVVVPWLSDSDYTGNSATAWYLFRAPSISAPMTVSFLNGNQTPVVEQGEMDFDELGISFRGYHDFGCDQAEYLAGIKSKGAA